jgi:hypothetical protein
MWKKPVHGVIKISVDAFFNLENVDGSTGAAARHNRGNYIAAATWFLPYVSTIDSAELVAIRNGLFLATQLGCSNLILESDCSFVVDYMQNPYEYQGMDVATVLECIDLAKDFGKLD